MAKPDDGYADASDVSTSLLGRFNRIYGVRPDAQQPQQSYRGNVGFILIETRAEETSMNAHTCTVSRTSAAIACAALAARALLVASVATLLAGCNTTTSETITTASIPADYRSRHPIRVKEGKKTLALFVGRRPRRPFSPVQRAEVLAFAQTWKREASGGVTIERPVGGANDVPRSTR